jgi:4-hydroxy-tetrahydrodipicolinate reductase
MSTNIVVMGALGKMGREISSAVLADPECVLSGCVEHPANAGIGKDYALCTGLNTPEVVVRSSPLDLQLSNSTIIDFTSPKASLSLLDSLAGKSTRLVIGTTGFTDDETEIIRKASSSFPIVLSPNMSLGVNLLFVLTELAAARLGESFDIEIVEAHHRFKKDSPSGTAKKLGEIAASALGLGYNDAVKNGRAGMVGERPRKEIGMHAVRGGDIVGDHTVLFAGIGERLELRHVAHSRATFARGAVVAAKWLSTQKPGLYSMRDVLGL